MCLWCQGAVQTDYISYLKHSFQVRTTAFGVESHNDHAYGLCSFCQPCACTTYHCFVCRHASNLQHEALLPCEEFRYLCFGNSKLKQITVPLQLQTQANTKTLCTAAHKRQLLLHAAVNCKQRMTKASRHVEKASGGLTDGSHADDPKCLAMQLHAKGIPNAALSECLLQATAET